MYMQRSQETLLDEALSYTWCLKAPHKLLLRSGSRTADSLRQIAFASPYDTSVGDSAMGTRDSNLQLLQLQTPKVPHVPLKGLLDGEQSQGNPMSIMSHLT